ncbi:MAG: hypothetical protein JRD93_12110 [Deltaproteobacteria bacterium]|nr:hypothetical protein [Deltaproteobacteria bacterium]
MADSSVTLHCEPLFRVLAVLMIMLLEGIIDLKPYGNYSQMGASGDTIRPQAGQRNLSPYSTSLACNMI